MKKEIAEAWVKDLRSNPPQITDALHTDKGDCCLGRLCLLVGAEFVRADDELDVGDQYVVKGTDEAASLPPFVMKAAGVNSHNVMLPDEAQVTRKGQTLSCLSELNDHGYTFDKIADIIEKNWEKL